MLHETTQTEKDRHHRYSESNSPTFTWQSPRTLGKCAQAKYLLRRHTWEGGRDCLVRGNKLEMHIPYSAAMTDTTKDTIQVKVNVVR